MSTIFLDRDGVINENRADYVKSWQEFKFLPGSREAIAKLTRAGHRIVICTNQAAIARGYLTIETLAEIHRAMLASISDLGGVVEKIYYCPHAKNENCACRKPRPGMILQAYQDLHINGTDAIFIGDSITDLQAGFAAGIHACFLVLTGLGLEQLHHHYQEATAPFSIASNLEQAAEKILQGDYFNSYAFMFQGYTSCSRTRLP